MNGIAFANLALSLRSQFFTNLPLELLFREGGQISHFNRHKLGSALIEQSFEFFSENLFSLVSRQACNIEQLEVR